MKARQVLVFILGVFLLLGMVWAVFPAGGIRLSGKTLRFASFQGYLRDAAEEKVDVDEVLSTLDSRFALQGDTLAFYKEFF